MDRHSVDGLHISDSTSSLNVLASEFDTLTLQAKAVTTRIGDKCS